MLIEDLRNLRPFHSVSLPMSLKILPLDFFFKSSLPRYLCTFDMEMNLLLFVVEVNDRRLFYGKKNRVLYKNLIPLLESTRATTKTSKSKISDGGCPKIPTLHLPNDQLDTNTILMQQNLVP